MMNYKELRKASDLLKKLQDIEFLIKNVEEERYVTIQCSGFSTTLLDEQKDKALELLKDTRDRILRRLKWLGVTEE